MALYRIAGEREQINLLRWACDKFIEIQGGRLTSAELDIIVPPGCGISNFQKDLGRIEYRFSLDKVRAVQQKDFNFSMLDEKDLWFLSNACDLISRIMICQFDRIADIVEPYNMGKDFSKLHKFREDLDDLKKYWGMSRNASYGMFSSQVSDDARTLWDMHQVIRNRLAYDNNPGITPENRWKMGKITVNFDDPFQSNPNVPLLKVERM